MMIKPRIALSLAAAMVLLASAGVIAQRRSTPAAPDDRTIVHVLNRLGFGAAPGDVERARRMGLEAYITAQLEPERIPNERLAARLAPFTTLSMSTRALSDEYFIPAMQERLARQREQTPAPVGGEQMQPATRPGPPNGERRVLLELSQQKILRAIYSERQLEEVMVDFWFNHFNVFAGKGQVRLYLTEYERDIIRPHVFGRFRDLLGAVAESPAMLFYLDNWQSSAAEGAETSMEMRGPRRRPPANVPVQNRRRGINENYARELMELHTLGVEGGYTQKDVTEVARAFTGWTIFAPRGAGLYAADADESRAGTFYFAPRMHDDGEKTVLGVKVSAGGGVEDGRKVLDILVAHPSTAKFIATKLARKFVSDTPDPALVRRVADAFQKSKGDIKSTLRALLTSPEFNSAEVRRAKIKTPFELAASALRTLGAEVEVRPALIQWVARMGEPLYGYQAPTGYPDEAAYWVNTGALLERLNFSLALVSNRIPGARVDLTRFVGEAAVSSRAIDQKTVVESFLNVALQGDISPKSREVLLRQLTAQTDAPITEAPPDEETRRQNVRAARRERRQADATVGNPEVARIAALVIGSPEFQRQ